MSAKISNVYRQSKERKSDTAKGKKPATILKASDAASILEDEGIQRQLLVFDLTAKWGPCTGISRLERWERASQLGLDPPQAVKDIIEAATGEERQQFNTGTWENRGI